MADAFNFAVAGAREDRPVTMQFSDGNQVVPGWMVAHLGGPGNVITRFSGIARDMTFEEFTREFFQEVASEELRNFQRKLIDGSMGRFQ